MIAPFISVAELDRMRGAAEREGTGEPRPRVVVVDSRWYLDGRSGAEAYARLAGEIAGSAAGQGGR